MMNDINFNYSESSSRIIGQSNRPASARVFRQKSVSAKKTLFTTPFFSKEVKPSNASDISNKKMNYLMEKEKLHEQVMQYTIVVTQLQKELNIIQSEIEEKDNQICKKDNEIATILQNIETSENLKTKFEENYNEFNSILLSNIRSECRTIIKELKEEQKISEILKKNFKLTKMNEYTIELEIANKQIDQIKQLVNNSIINRNVIFENISAFKKFDKTIQNQNYIIDSLKESIKNESQKEIELKSEVEVLKKKIGKSNNAINILCKDNLILMKNNETIIQDKHQPMNDSMLPALKKKRNYDIYYYSERIKNLEQQLFQLKKEANKGNKAIYNLQGIKNSFLKAKGNNNYSNTVTESANHIIFGQSDKQIQDCKIKSQEKEQEIIKLREILNKSKSEEEKLTSLIYTYEDKIKNYNQQQEERNCNQSQMKIEIKSDNPFYSNDYNNNPVQTQKFTNEQYNQFVFVLFKNFEAKGITQKIANKKIFVELMPNNTDSKELIEVLMEKFANKTIDLLKCNNEYDKINLTILFGALCYQCNSDFNLISNYFLSLFNYIHFYTKEAESLMIKRLKTKYSSNINRLIIKVKKLNLTGDYISLMQLKQLIDNHIGLKDKYIEFLFYLMKGFNDESATLSDLKLNILYDLDINTQKNSYKIIPEKKNDDNEYVQEITKDEYVKLISESLTQIKQFLVKSNLSFRQYLSNNIMMIDNPSNCEVIFIETLNNELLRKNIELSALQLSCLFSRYNVNDQLQALSIDQIEYDLNKIEIIQS